MFSDSVVMLVLGFSLIGCLIYMHHSNSKALFSQIAIIQNEISEKTSTGAFDLSELKEDMLDMVHETIGNMQPPNAFDHLLGALAGPIQAWAMRKDQEGVSLVDSSIGAKTASVRLKQYFSIESK